MKNKYKTPVAQTLLFDDYFKKESTFDTDQDFKLIPIDGILVRIWSNPKVTDWIFLDNKLYKIFNFEKNKSAADFIKTIFNISKKKMFYPEQLLFRNKSVIIYYQNIKYNNVCDTCIEMCECIDLLYNDYI